MKQAQSLLLTSEYLPVVGEEHPLRKKYTKFLLTGAIIAALLHLIGFGAWLTARSMHREAPVHREAKLIKIADLGVPPSLSAKDVSTQVAISEAVAPPTIGIPEPVPDFQAPHLTMASQDEMVAQLTPTDLSSLNSGPGDSLVVSAEDEGDGSNSPDRFEKVDEPPVLISITSPVYPEMARAAETEGVVKVRVLIGKDGRIKDAQVIDGNTMLDEAAVAAAKTAVFKPALSQHRPVEVLLDLPIRFSLH
jgi:periplasmic protein TonB